MNKIMLIGAGGHGRVVLEALNASGIKAFGFYDDSISKGTVIDGLEVVGNIEDLLSYDEKYSFIVCIGRNEPRKRIYEKLIGRGADPYTIIHPRAYVAGNVIIGRGTIICAAAFIGVGTVIGDNCIINTNSSIDHECIIENHAQVQPGAVLTGNVSLGELSTVGSGSIIIPGVRVEKNSIVGAGAVVTKNLEEGKVWTGIPAKEQRSIESDEL